ncbi:holo-ACP synthase [Campylobacter sp. RM13119]|uniref:holo-ACP synthase n=1 Tax=Campylobacter TaxID=194 RepID=UPI001473A493|nr:MULTISPECIES: holo-ACP synthase [unclassified Campylobacter]MBE3022244.1 holo-ACP synthase [Campylobacter sp. 7477a]MBE3606956.1 holo-ACP synthase [Campylobacter sp. RM13119]MBE3610047.1 holo-ACP synthase [Campylobacter sp. RM12916]
MIGIDIVAIDRIARLKARYNETFLARFLSPSEIALVKSDATAAGFWAAKEAASKALGVGISAECSFFDIIVEKDAKNAPILKFTPKVYEKFNIKNASLSIAHDGGFAIAAVMLECF